MSKQIDPSYQPPADRELTIEEIHDAEHGMLEAISASCKENGVNWCLGYGTLLGTIRAGGLIPWDDDADIWMSREDYDSFLNSWKDTDRYRLVRPFSREYSFGWAKIVDTWTEYYNPRIVLPKDYGLALDIFVRDATCGSSAFKRIHKEKFLRGMACVTPRKEEGKLAKYLVKVVVHTAFKVLPSALYGEKAFMKALKEGQQTEELAQTHNINAQSGYSYERDLLKNEWFEGQREAECDGHIYPVPAKSEDILVHLYGENWKTPIEYPRHAHLYWRQQ